VSNPYLRPDVEDGKLAPENTGETGIIAGRLASINHGLLMD
jgi:hypothetical protein